MITVAATAALSLAYLHVTPDRQAGTPPSAAGHLLTLESTWPAHVRLGGRAASLLDDDFSELFSQVPAAQTLAQQAHDAAVAAEPLRVIGRVSYFASLVPSLVGLLIPGAVIIGVASSLVLLVGSVVFALLTWPLGDTRKQALAAVDAHNRGLFELHSAPTPTNPLAALASEHWLTVEVDQTGQAGLQARRRERHLSLADPSFASMFTLVPEARDLAQSAHENHVHSQRVSTAGSFILGPALGALLLAVVVGPAIFLAPLLLTSAALAMVGSVLILVVAPSQNGETECLAAVDLHNRALLERRPVPGASGASTVDAAFRDGLAYALPR